MQQTAVKAMTAIAIHSTGIKKLPIVTAALKARAQIVNRGSTIDDSILFWITV
jgi:hypothetical protein